MGELKQINIKNRFYYFYNDIIDLDEFDESKIKVDKKDFNVIDIYYLGYEHREKNSECKVINSVNPLYLRIADINGQGKDDVWYLIISGDDDVFKKLVDIFGSIKHQSTEETWDIVKYDKDYMKIKLQGNNILPADKDVNIHLGTIIARSIFAQDSKYYSQLFLDNGLYKF